MRRVFPFVPIVSLALLAIVFIQTLNAGGHNSVIKGWLSDESCASGRAVSGDYTATNPDCAKKCVHEKEKKLS